MPRDDATKKYVAKKDSSHFVVGLVCAIPTFAFRISARPFISRCLAVIAGGCYLRSVSCGAAETGAYPGIAGMVFGDSYTGELCGSGVSRVALVQAHPHRRFFSSFRLELVCLYSDESMNTRWPNQALQATADKRLGWQVGRQRPAVPELIRYATSRRTIFGRRTILTARE